MPDKPSKLMAALYGGLIMGVISGIPGLNYVNCLCCAGILLGGFLSVFFYKKELTPQMPPLTSGDGVALGSLAGVFGGMTTTIVSLLVQSVTGMDIATKVNEALDKLGDRISPETVEMIRSFIGEGGISPLMVAVSFGGNLILGVLFGLLGGLIGYSVFKPKTPMMNVQPPPSVPPAQS